MKAITKLILGSFVLFLAACSGVNVSEQPPAITNTSAAEYRIGVSDQLQINVWKNPELSLSVPVRPDGKISMPLVGDVTAQGLTASELTDQITSELKTFLKSPQVVVIVQSAASTDFLLRVRATGAVQRATSIPYKDGMRVLDLILVSGGLTEFAAGNKAKLFRTVDGEVKVYKVRLNDILNKGKLTTNYQLAPSDIITVPERVF